MNIRKILIAGLMFILMIIIGTAGYEWTEHLSFFNALWLTVVSILTIGYGICIRLRLQEKFSRLFLSQSRSGWLHTYWHNLLPL
ncbi:MULTISPECIES: ion channel [unclassified Heyndrickxia]|uniref:ion channel n=1 Tax=unclassified Heyndrickxia TaxID=2837518 RepID=UPI0030F8BB53